MKPPPVRYHPVPALAVAAIAALVLFGGIAWAIRNGPLPFDEPILRALRDPANLELPIGPAWIGALLRSATALAASATLIPLAAAGAAWLAWRGSFAVAGFVLAAMAGGAAVNALLKQIFSRTRPDIVQHLVETHTTGFPSGHSFNAASACVVLCCLLALVRRSALRWVGVFCAVAFAALAGLSRLYFGVHWPSDVIAGWSAGAAWAMLCGAVLLRRPLLDRK